MAAPTHDTGRVRSGDVELHYRRFGHAGKTPILIAHGLSYFSYDWIEVGNALSADRMVVAADTRGFGDSDWSAAKDYSVPTLANDIIAILDALNWREAIVIGHSMSGRATSLAAASRPDRVMGLALIDYTPENAAAGSKRVTDSVAGQPDVFESVDAGMRYFGVDPNTPEGQAKRARFEAYLKPVAGGVQLKRDLFFRDQFRRVRDHGERPKLGVDMWEVIGRIRCPILSMRGARSDMYAPATADKMKAANPRLHVVEVDAGHNVAAENHAGFLAAINPFIASLES
ncbi:MAG: alpha/beta fold hydrolase [Burkholderiales bacterium]